MKTIILGSGVVGATAAYYLAKAGIEVTVIDRQPGAALETSFAAAPASLSRRRFMQLMAASLALAGLGGCEGPPPEQIVPYVHPPEGDAPEEPLFFATAMALGADFLGAFPGRLRYARQFAARRRAGECQPPAVHALAHAMSQALGGIGHTVTYSAPVVSHPGRQTESLRARAAGMAAAGAERFREHGCSGCHGEAASVHAPNLEGLFGKPVPLESGGTVIADERYIRDSILLPKKQIVAGYEPIMPSFEGQIDEDDILEIIAYIKSLGQSGGSTP